jgi:thioredoxin 1
MSSFQQILNDPKPVLIDFYAEWCGPCKMMPPILKELKEKMGETLRIIKIDVDKNQQIASKYQVRGVSTLMLMKEGSVLWKQSGVMDANSLHKTIQNHL